MMLPCKWEELRVQRKKWNWCSKSLSPTYTLIKERTRVARQGQELRDKDKTVYYQTINCREVNWKVLSERNNMRRKVLSEVRVGVCFGGFSFNTST